MTKMLHRFQEQTFVRLGENKKIDRATKVETVRDVSAPTLIPERCWLIQFVPDLRLHLCTMLKLCITKIHNISMFACAAMYSFSRFRGYVMNKTSCKPKVNNITIDP